MDLQDQQLKDTVYFKLHGVLYIIEIQYDNNYNKVMYINSFISNKRRRPNRYHIHRLFSFTSKPSGSRHVDRARVDSAGGVTFACYCYRSCNCCRCCGRYKLTGQTGTTTTVTIGNLQSTTMLMLYMVVLTYTCQMNMRSSMYVI